MSLSLEQSIPLAYPEAFPATYPKLNFSTYLGGNETDRGYDIAVSADGSCYVTGATQSADFPILNAYFNFSNKTDAFVAKFSPNGELLWSTFLGGSYYDTCFDIAVGSDGSCYVIGETESNDFPTLNAYNSTFGGFLDAFIAKFSSSGSLLWSTYLGGNDYDHCRGVAVANDGSCYITGSTESSDFPTKNAYDSSFNGGLYGDVFVAKFSASGFLLWSTYLGGSEEDYGHSIAIASDNSCYLSGFTSSNDFPTLNAYDSTCEGIDAFVTKFSASGVIQWSTFLGGSNLDKGLGIATASNGNCYITGFTYSSDFPTKNAYDESFNRDEDVFITKFSTYGSLLWSTYLGGISYERGHDIAVLGDDICLVVGQTTSDDFPMSDAYNSTYGGSSDAFVVKFNSGGSLLWSTFLGGSDSDNGNGVAVASDGSCYVTGKTASGNFPTLNAFDDSFNGSELYGDAFVMKFVDSYNPLVNEAGRRQLLIRSISISISLLLVIIISIVVYSLTVPRMLRNRKVLQVLGEYAEQGTYQILLTELCEKTKLPETLLEKTLLDSKVQQIHQTISHKENVYLVSSMDFEQLVASIEKRISSVDEQRVSEEIRFQTITSSQIELEELKALARKLTKQEIVAKCDGIISILDDMLQEIEFESLLDE